jgi:hypothetical protein
MNQKIIHNDLMQLANEQIAEHSKIFQNLKRRIR